MNNFFQRQRVTAAKKRDGNTLSVKQHCETQRAMSMELLDCDLCLHVRSGYPKEKKRGYGPGHHYCSHCCPKNDSAEKGGFTNVPISLIFFELWVMA